MAFEKYGIDNPVSNKTSVNIHEVKFPTTQFSMHLTFDKKRAIDKKGYTHPENGRKGCSGLGVPREAGDRVCGR